MKLSKLCETITINGNVAIALFPEEKTIYFRNTEGFHISLSNFPELGETTVSHMYAEKAHDGYTWLTIEVIEEGNL